MIPVIDLFAGPGGLGEGFSVLRSPRGSRIFKIGLSIEKDPLAHRTLLLRSFFRQFERRTVPEDYYSCIRGEFDIQSLFRKFPTQAKGANSEAICAELGTHDWKDIDRKIKNAIGRSRRWVLVGGPPCQAYSLVGRSRMRRKNPRKFREDKRHLLYREYLRIIAAHRPPVFVMENVKGMLSSKLRRNRIIDRILADLREPHAALPELVAGASRDPLSYDLYALGERDTSNLDRNVSPEKYLVRCEDHGIPQARHRVIVVGVRKDMPCHVEILPRKKRIPMWSVISDLPELRSRLSNGEDSPEEWLRVVRETSTCEVVPCTQLEPVIREAIQRAAAGLTARRNIGAEFVKSSAKPQWRPAWFYDPKLGGALNHSARSHIPEDLRRYFFASCYGECKGKSPSISDFPPSLIPKHKNLTDGKGGDIVFADRFRVQIAGRPSTTVTSHISKDGHYFIHPDPTQCRSLTVREAARLQTFPDNYFFAGPRTAQYHQVGNAVPPLLAKDIARVVAHIFSFGRAKHH